MNGVTPQQMAEIDSRAQNEYNIPQAELMDNAGRAVFEHIFFDMKRFGFTRAKVLCGKGNNGGDGFAAARYLFEKDPESVIIYAADADNMKEGAANDNYKRARDARIEIKDLSAILEDPCGTGVVFVDALFGTGFSGEIKGLCASAIEYMNSSVGYTYAVDIPSGLNGGTGESSRICVRAAKTITFGLPKSGFFMGNGPRLCGEVIVEKIGFPEKLLAEYC